MTVPTDDFSEKIAALERVVWGVKGQYPENAKAIGLCDLLLAQIKVVERHYSLIMLETDERFFLSQSAFVDLVSGFRGVLKIFRSLPKIEAKSTYELTSIGDFYEFVAHHFQESEPK